MNAIRIVADLIAVARRPAVDPWRLPPGWFSCAPGSPPA